ncbi:hypothetical protein TSUD_67270 [Trifolium subterraneum]|uniref:Uncharacterized protein n=1 Tax=Trifolium subterraneum TaxID=3900 RepID=A0A2Z6NX95_TRISU|nr:hypothetical protein TSUD_67270 [Trifolium subterraneum]
MSDDATPIRTSASMPPMTELTYLPFEYNSYTNGGDMTNVMASAMAQQSTTTQQVVVQVQCEALRDQRERKVFLQ